MSAERGERPKRQHRKRAVAIPPDLVGTHRVVILVQQAQAEGYETVGNAVLTFGITARTASAMMGKVLSTNFADCDHEPKASDEKGGGA